FDDRMGGDPGYADLLRVAHEASAVSAACLLTRRSDYLAVGGMDDIRFPLGFGDVDYCLRLRARGKRIVWTPHARLVCPNSARQAGAALPDVNDRMAREIQNLRNRWGSVLLNDPYYNPTLSLDAKAFSALSWPVRPLATRLNAPPAMADVPPGF